jgi:hypothetical protein
LGNTLGLTPVDPVRTSERAAGQFVEMIRSQKLSAGDRLPSEQALAQDLMPRSGWPGLRRSSGDEDEGESIDRPIDIGQEPGE